MAKSDKVFLKTPPAPFVYPNIDRADRKYGNFKVDLRLTKAQASEIKKVLVDVTAEKFGAAKAKKANFKCFKVEKDEDGKPTGFITLRATSKFAVPVYDRHGNQVPENKLPRIGGGSVGILDLAIGPYKDDVGAKPYLQGVYLLKLVEYKTNRGLGDMDLGEYADDEDGFSVSDADDSDDLSDDNEETSNDDDFDTSDDDFGEEETEEEDDFSEADEGDDEDDPTAF